MDNSIEIEGQTFAFIVDKDGEKLAINDIINGKTNIIEDGDI
jgi:superoxide dismutase